MIAEPQNRRAAEPLLLSRRTTELPNSRIAEPPNHRPGLLFAPWPRLPLASLASMAFSFLTWLPRLRWLLWPRAPLATSLSSETVKHQLCPFAVLSCSMSGRRLSATNAAKISTQLEAATTDFLYNPESKLSELFPEVVGDAELLDAIFQVYEAIA